MQTSKRHFLKCTGTLLAGVAAYRLAYATAHPEAKPDAAKQYILIHDQTQCIGCDACAIACRQTNQVPAEVSRLTIIRHGPYGEYPNQQYHFERQSCQQCENAPCVMVCPTGAAYRDPQTGIIKVDDWKCVGCQYCIAACPYQVRFINPVTRAADKCDFCAETKLKQGELPACVQACPTQALQFGDSLDKDAQVRKTLNSAAVIRANESLGTRPKVFIIADAKGEVTI